MHIREDRLFGLDFRDPLKAQFQVCMTWVGRVAECVDDEEVSALAGFQACLRQDFAIIAISDGAEAKAEAVDLTMILGENLEIQCAAWAWYRQGLPRQGHIMGIQ